MQARWLTLLAITIFLLLSGCGSSGDDPNTLVRLPTSTTVVDPGSESANNSGTSTDSGGDQNPNLFNGRHKVELGSIDIRQQTPINYDSRLQQEVYLAFDGANQILCYATFTIALVDLGPNASYTNFITSLENSDSAPSQTISIVDIPGPTINVGIEYTYSFEVEIAEELQNWTSVAHLHYFNPQDVTFNSPALSSIECATQTNRFGQNEAQLRAVLSSVEFLRGTDSDESDVDR